MHYRLRSERPWSSLALLGLLLICGEHLGGLRYSRAQGWETSRKEPGYCAFNGVCGRNSNGEVPCAENSPARKVDQSLSAAMAMYCPRTWDEIKEEGLTCCDLKGVRNLYVSTSLAAGILGGCPACIDNFVDLWCTVSCSPNQATFINVTKVNEVETGKFEVLEADYFFTDEYKNALYDSCTEVKVGAANIRALQAFKNPHNPNDWLGFMGNASERAPYQIFFPDEAPKEGKALNKSIPGCGSPGYECSCADCSSADYCVAIPPPTPEKSDPRFSWALKFILPLGLLMILLFAFAFGLACKNNTIFADPDFGSESDADTGLLYGSGAQPVASRMDAALSGIFKRYGFFVGAHPWVTLLLAGFLFGICAGGLAFLEIETDPEGLWTPHGSRSYKEQQKYIDSFGEFFRIETMIISTNEDPETGEQPSIVTKENLDLMFELQSIVDGIQAGQQDGEDVQNVTLSDVCFKPMGDACAIESVLQYWQMNKENWETKIKIWGGPEEAAAYCFEHWTTGGVPAVSCMSNFLAPIEPKIVLGGFPEGTETGMDYVESTTAFVVTYPVDSSEEKRSAALAWESAFVEMAMNKLKPLVESRNLTISFLTERSVQDELERESNTDVITIAVSYLAMFIYVALALSWTQANSGKCVTLNRVFLALGGVLLVGLAVVGSLGLCSWFGVKATLIIMEVIPFLVLAVGVDNMFILAHELDAQNTDEPLVARLTSALSASGPSITFAASAEALTFALGAIVPVPAVRSFSLCACFAILLDYIFQVTAFAALLMLNTSWVESRSTKTEAAVNDYVVVESGTPSQTSLDPPPKMCLHKFISSVHIPVLVGADALGHVLRGVILGLSLLMFLAASLLIPFLSKGLEQQVALPRDSYLQDFFSDGLEYLRVGPPVMFVVEGMEVSPNSSDISNICGIAGCEPDSLVSQIALAKKAGAFHIASPAASWIDDFLLWLKLPKCCQRTIADGSHCPYVPGTEMSCLPCSLEMKDDRPTVEQIQEFMPWFMDTIPSQFCARGGSGAYDSSIEHFPNDPTKVTGLSEGIVKSSSFRAYYQPLSSQEDFINALQETREFVDSRGKELGLDIYGYSTFHVFFESYLNVGWQAGVVVGSAIISGFFVGWLFLGSAWVSALVMLCVLMTMVDLLGVMKLWGIQLNGVSIVNLAMGVGIAMEFCMHIARSFMIQQGSRGARVAGAMEGVGAAIISGITLTKFVGVIVLAFSQTQIFEVYYFRMYLGLVLFGAWHGLVLLPVLLALFGPPSSGINLKSFISKGRVQSGTEEPLVE